MNTWFRLYNEVLHDPKVQSLSGDLFKTWVNLLCISSKNDGKLPEISDIAFLLRRRPTSVAKEINALQANGLLDMDTIGDTAVRHPHNWDGRQFKSDGSTERVQRFRERHMERFSNVTETKMKQDQTQTQTQTPLPPHSPNTNSNRSSKTERLAAEKAARVSAPDFRVFGEFGNVRLTEEEHAKLLARLNGQCQAYIDRLDRWGAEQPRKFAQRKSHYATLLNWYDRDVKEGRAPQARAKPAETEIDPKGVEEMRKQLRKQGRIT